MKKISAIILAGNAENLIKDCLESLSWVDEILVINTGSTDKTVNIAKKFKAQVFTAPKGNFSDWRNFGAKKAEGDWLFYVDVDERVTPLLRKEIQKVISKPKNQAYAIPRKNILLGHEMKHGGWWPDYVLRLMRKESLKGWKGELHEQPEIKGSVGKLKNPLTHFTHRNLFEMVEKTNKWSEIEARLLFESGHPKMVWWRFLSVAFREFWYRAIRERGFLDGPVGIIEIIYQMYSRMITYAKLWEMQLKTQNANVKSQN